jgi:hypothetical protein
MATEKRKPREWWLVLSGTVPFACESEQDAIVQAFPGTEIVHVREVLEEDGDGSRSFVLNHENKDRMIANIDKLLNEMTDGKG